MCERSAHSFVALAHSWRRSSRDRASPKVFESLQAQFRCATSAAFIDRARARGALVKSDYIARIARERRAHRDAATDVHTEHRAFAKRHDTVPSNHVFCAMEGKRARRRRRARAMACVYIPLSVSAARSRRPVRRRVRVANARKVLRSRITSRRAPRSRRVHVEPCETSTLGGNSFRRARAVDTSRIVVATPRGRDSCRQRCAQLTTRRR